MSDWFYRLLLRGLVGRWGAEAVGGQRGRLSLLLMFTLPLSHSQAYVESREPEYLSPVVM